MTRIATKILMIRYNKLRKNKDKVCSLKVTQQISAANQPLRVAAYCRVSTKHEEQ